MDNVTHSLTGWALGQAGLKTKARKGLAALILGANMPDIDVFFQWAPWEPLATHRGFTHSLVAGVLVMPPILCGLLLLLDRWQQWRGIRFRSGLEMHKGWLLALCYLGALTHPLLDLQTTYSVQLFSPFSGAWWHSDSVFIIDVWLWLIIGGTIWLSKRMEKNGEPDWRRPVQVAIGIALAYIGLNLGISQAAARSVERRHPQASAIFASPPPFLFWRRGMSWRERGHLGFADFDPAAGGLGPDKPTVGDNMHDPVVRAAIRRDPRLAKFLKWSILPRAEVFREKCRLRIAIGDARYGIGQDSRLARESVFSTGGPGCLRSTSVR